MLIPFHSAARRTQPYFSDGASVAPWCGAWSENFCAVSSIVRSKERISRSISNRYRPVLLLTRYLRAASSTRNSSSVRGFPRQRRSNLNLRLRLVFLPPLEVNVSHFRTRKDRFELAISFHVDPLNARIACWRLGPTTLINTSGLVNIPIIARTSGIS